MVSSRNNGAFKIGTEVGVNCRIYKEVSKEFLLEFTTSLRAFVFNTSDKDTETYRCLRNCAVINSLFLEEY